MQAAGLLPNFSGMKPFALSLVVCLLCACQSPRKQYAHPPLFAYGNARLLQYDQFVAGLDTQQAKVIPIAAQQFRSLFRGQSPAACDTGYFIFEQLCKKVTQSLNRQMLADTTTRYEVLIMDSVDGHKPVIPARLEAYERQLKENGFKVQEEEGMPYVAFDRDFIVKYFYSYVSRTMKQYLVQVNKEEKEGFADDAALVISPVELADRTVWWEKFTQQTPPFLFTEQAKERKALYLRVLIEGTDNTPVMEGNSLAGYYETAYDYLKQKYGNTQTGNLTTSYQNAVVRHDTLAVKQIATNYSL